MPKRMCGEENLIPNIESLFKVTNAIACVVLAPLSCSGCTVIKWSQWRIHSRSHNLINASCLSIYLLPTCILKKFKSSLQPLN